MAVALTITAVREAWRINTTMSMPRADWHSIPTKRQPNSNQTATELQPNSNQIQPSAPEIYGIMGFVEGTITAVREAWRINITMSMPRADSKRQPNSNQTATELQPKSNQIQPSAR